MEPQQLLESTFPGTVIERGGKSAEEFLEGLFFATKGLTLSQVREITALDTPALQNWVSRGWVQRPVEKRYGKDHLARILLINMLRDAAKLETIANILTYLNGSAGCREDDSISESQFYSYLCDILSAAKLDDILSGGLEGLIESRTKDYREPFEGAHEKMMNAAKLILTYYAAASIKKRADRLWQSVQDRERGGS